MDALHEDTVSREPISFRLPPHHFSMTSLGKYSTPIFLQGA